jgi:hypothetical protein
VKSAILATDSTIVHYCQLHAIITKTRRSLFEYFNNEKTSARWLGVQLERLGESPCEPGTKQRVISR